MTSLPRPHPFHTSLPYAVIGFHPAEAETVEHADPEDDVCASYVRGVAFLGLGARVL